MAMELQGLFLIAATTLGFVSLSKHLASIFKWVWVMFLRPPKNLQHYGSWAMVTGSTDGIGKALVFELASKGLNLVLIGRDPSKLKVTSDEIRERYGEQVEIRNIVIDFTKFRGEEIVKTIEEEIKGLDVGILINNAGLGYPNARFFDEVETELMENLIRVNLEATTWVTRAVLPGMLKKKIGAIVNIGSGSSVTVSSFPLYTIYAATKAYVEMFSKCINVEYEQHGIDIQCQIPLFVATKMIPMKRIPLFIPSPEMFSRASIRMIGYERICVPYWGHSLQWCITHAFPDVLMDSFIFTLFRWFHEKGL